MKTVAINLKSINTIKKLERLKEVIGKLEMLSIVATMIILSIAVYPKSVIASIVAILLLVGAGIGLMYDRHSIFKAKRALYFGNPAGNLWADTIFLFWGILALCFDDMGNFPISLFIAGVVTVSLDFVLCILNVIHRKQ